MPANPKTLYGVISILVALVVILSAATALFYIQNSQTQAQNSTYLNELNKANVRYVSDVFIGYGNGTNVWYNDTLVKPGWNLYTVTLLVTNGNVNATCCEFGSHFVQGIGGVQNDNAKNWFLWTYNGTSLWSTAQLGPDEITVQNNTIFAWTFCGYDSNYNPTCKP